MHLSKFVNKIHTQQKLKGFFFFLVCILYNEANNKLLRQHWQKIMINLDPKLPQFPNFKSESTYNLSDLIIDSTGLPAFREKERHE